ncbi:hypothetical protein V6N12_073977 [Hibiscus sabdariffa]|uniref:glutamate-5-semialdehyde dehydrogenase n=1 Tax=Hibiscus sabdariffa TaxID=183260 RepID=A0ABR1ZYW4_9ROSI
MAVAARQSSRRLQALSSEERKKILLDIADALEANENLITAENETDVAAAQEAGYEKSLISRLALKSGKILSLAKSIRVLANMEDPIGCVLKETQLADGLVLEKTSSPLGVLLIVFESRPDALVQIASLAIRSGNGLLLKGGKEAKRSNAILHKVITEAIPDTVGGKVIGLVTSRDEIPGLLKLDDVIDLVIPRGSNKLVSQIKSSTKIPVLGHADGICHVYVDKSANLEMAKRIVLDAKVDYPAACNAMETLLVHKDLVQNGALNELIVDLRIQGVSLYGGPRASALLNIPQARSFHHEYNSMECTVEIVDDVAAAVDHIHQHGRHVILPWQRRLSTYLRLLFCLDVCLCFHEQKGMNYLSFSPCAVHILIVSSPKTEKLRKSSCINAAVFHNASTRFCDGARFGLGAEVGISTSRIHARGPVGVEGLLTTRWILKGSGQVVDGDKGVIYTHRDISVDSLKKMYQKNPKMQKEKEMAEAAAD